MGLNTSDKTKQNKQKKTEHIKKLRERETYFSHI